MPKILVERENFKPHGSSRQRLAKMMFFTIRGRALRGDRA